MNILSKLFGGTRVPTEPDIVQLNGNDDFTLEVVGESHYQHNLETICGSRTEQGENRIVEARLILEDSNPHDNKAVRVEISGLEIGGAKWHKSIGSKLGRMVTLTPWTLCGKHQRWLETQRWQYRTLWRLAGHSRRGD